MWWFGAALAANGAAEGAFSSVTITAACTLELKLAETSAVTWRFTSTEANPVQFAIQGGVLTVKSNGSFSDCVIEGTTTGVTRLSASGGAQVRMGPMKGQRLEIVGLGASALEVAAVDGERLKIDLAGASSLTVTEGRVQFQKSTLSSGSSLVADGVRSDVVEIQASGASAAHIYTLHKLVARATGASSIGVAGKPTQRDVKADLTSTVDGV